MAKYQVLVELEIDDEWLPRFHGHEETAVGNLVLELLETDHLTPDWAIEVTLLDPAIS